MSIFVSATQAAFKLSPTNSAFVTQMAAASNSRGLPTAIALAIAVNTFTDLPAGNVDSPEEYFDQQSGRNAADAISVINDLFPVDYRSAIRIARELYLIRYELAQKPFQAFGYNHKQGVACIFGLQAHMSEEVLNAIECSPSEILPKVGRFREIIENLRKE